MKLVFTVTELRNAVAQKRNGTKVGFVPTMGALHEGHASLVKQSVAENGLTVASVFVNPTQFNDKKDLETYPRDLDADCKILAASGADIVFAPSVEEVYPEDDTRVFDFTPLDKVMEGCYRPGHFNGVAQVVSRLFDIVSPDRAYFGEKDFQQLAIVKALVKKLGLDIEIRTCPTVREPDGLAMSSRNMLLTREGRRRAPAIYEVLERSIGYAATHTVAETADFVAQGMHGDGYLRMQYYSIVDGRTLQPVDNWDDSDYVVGCIAAFCDNVRLIDNVKYKPLMTVPYDD